MKKETFVTLEQYNKLSSEIATVKMSLEAVSKSVTDLETRINNKISNDIATAVSAVNVTIQQKVLEVTNAYMALVNSTKSEITVAYTAAIKTAISDADASMKLWVNESLSAYSTIADVEAKIAVLQNACGKSDDALQAEIDSIYTIIADSKERIYSFFDHLEFLVRPFDEELSEKIADKAMDLEDSTSKLIEYYLKNQDESLEEIRRLILLNKIDVISLLYDKSKEI